MARVARVARVQGDQGGQGVDWLSNQGLLETGNAICLDESKLDDRREEKEISISPKYVWLGLLQISCPWLELKQTFWTPRHQQTLQNKVAQPPPLL